MMAENIVGSNVDMTVVALALRNYPCSCSYYVAIDERATMSEAAVRERVCRRPGEMCSPQYKPCEPLSASQSTLCLLCV